MVNFHTEWAIGRQGRADPRLLSPRPSADSDLIHNHNRMRNSMRSRIRSPSASAVFTAAGNMAVEKHFIIENKNHQFNAKTKPKLFTQLSKYSVVKITCRGLESAFVRVRNFSSTKRPHAVDPRCRNVLRISVHKQSAHLWRAREGR